MTAFEELIDLRSWLNEQIHIEECVPTYYGTQKAIAYRRVLERLKPIIRRANKVRDELDFVVEVS